MLMLGITAVALTIPVLFIAVMPQYPVMTGKLPAWTCQPISGSYDPKYCRVAEEAIATLPDSHKAQGAHVRISENRNCRCFSSDVDILLRSGITVAQ